MLAVAGAVPSEQGQRRVGALQPQSLQQQQEQQQQEQQQQPLQQHTCGDAGEADEAEDADQFDALMTMLKFNELCQAPAGAAPAAPKSAAGSTGRAAAAVKAEGPAAAAAAGDGPAAAVAAAAAATAAAAAAAGAAPEPAEAGPAVGIASDDAPDAAGTLMELGFMAALAAATHLAAGPPRRGTSSDSSGTRVGGPGRGPSQESVSNAEGEDEEEQQRRRQQGPAQVHSPGEQEFAAAAALAAAAAAAQEAAEADDEAARRGRRVRAAKRRQHDVAEGSDLEDEGLGLDDAPGGDGGRGGKRRRGGAARAPKVPKGERKYTSSELSIAIFEAEGVFNMRLDDAARHLGFGSPTSIKKAMARLRIIKWPNRTRETAKNILAGLEEYLKRYCDAGTTAAVMDRARARLQPYLECTTAIELSEDLRKLRQKVYKLKDQDHDPAYTEANMRRCVERLVEDIMGEGFARSPSPGAGA